MRTRRSLLLLLALAAPFAGAAADLVPLPPPPTLPTVPENETLPAVPEDGVPEIEKASDGGLPSLGVLVDVGLPDGVALAIAYRGFPWLRASLGGSWNGIGYGVQAGLGWTPFRWTVSPSLTLEAGHSFDSDVRWLADHTSAAESFRPLLRRVRHRYVTSQLGLEVGSPRSVSFFVRAGLSYLEVDLRGTGGTGDGGEDGFEVTLRDPSLRAVVPSAKLGFLFWF